MAEEAEPEARSIGARTLRGLGWAYGSYVGGKLLVLVTTAILARLLTPEDFGLVALALTYIAFLDAISDLGLTPALIIQKPEELMERAETVFVGTVLTGLAIGIATAALSPLAASFFDAPGLVGIGIALGFNFFLRGLGRTHFAIAQKLLDFRVQTVAELFDVILRGLAGIAFAIAGFGAWALVIGYLVGTMARNVAIWAQVRWRPKLKPRWDHFRELFGFGAALTGVNLIASYISTIDDIFVGKVLGTVSLGVYTIAFRLPELVIVNISVVAGTVLFPAFTAVDREGLAHAFLVSIRYTLLLTLPLATILVILSEPIILVAFGDQWTGAIVPMQLIALYSLLVTVGIPAGSVYKATGRAQVLLGLGLLRGALVTVALILFVDDGIEAVALSQAIVAVVGEGLGILLAQRLLKVSVREIFGEAWTTITATALMAVPLVSIERSIESPLLAVLAGGLAAGVVYLAAVGVLAPQYLRHVGRLIAGGQSPAET